ncbi:MAG: hypothetical protein M3O67_09945 [Bacteroidota bacterium]|nr:hypothetical protein [Bacteroidota bacterium]
MAINKNHEFEELNGVKCGIVERKVSSERVQFLKKLLEFNHYTVVVVPTPPPKVVPIAIGTPVVKTEEGAASPPPPPPLPPASETFTLGVTDITFNPINAIFGRLLHTKDGHVVTQAYWQQKEAVSHDEIPYYENK